MQQFIRTVAVALIAGILFSAAPLFVHAEEENLESGQPRYSALAIQNWQKQTTEEPVWSAEV